MKLHERSKLGEEHIINAVIEKRDAEYAHGPVLVLDGHIIVEPSFAAVADYSIVKATAKEREALIKAGYDLPDWVPPKDGSPCTT